MHSSSPSGQSVCLLCASRMSRMFCVISLIVTNRDPGGSRLEGGLGQRGHTGWWGSLSGTCERVGGCGECECLHD